VRVMHVDREGWATIVHLDVGPRDSSGLPLRLHAPQHEATIYLDRVDAFRLLEDLFREVMNWRE
jgi:hypothetical protein